MTSLFPCQLGEDTDDDDDDNDPLSLAQTLLEIDYQTYIDDEDNGVDEYCALKDTLQGKYVCERESWLYYNLIFVVIQTTDSDWFALITSSLNEEMATKLQTLFVTADQRRAAMGKFLLNNNNPGISSNNIIMILCNKLLTVEVVSKNRTLLATIYRTFFICDVFNRGKEM